MPTRRSPPSLAALAAALAGVAVLAACAGKAPPPSPSSTGAEPIPVAASVPPAAWVAERIGGDRVAVTTLLPPGRSPHTWEPAPRELVALSRARLVVVVGHPALPFEERLLTAARQGGEPAVVALTDGIELLPDAEGHAHGDEHGHEAAHGHREAAEPSAEGETAGTSGGARLAATDPHVWLDPLAMRSAAARIAETLAGIDPDHAAGYRARLAGLEAEIDALDREIRDLLAGAPERRFLAYHPAWGYFAARYGLIQESVEVGGKEPGTRGLVDRVGEARARGTRTIFVQTSVSGRGARVIAGEIGAEVVALDPLAYDWDENLREVAAAMAKALGASPPASPDADADAAAVAAAGASRPAAEDP